MLFVCSYYYPTFLCAYIIACKILTFSTTVGLMYFELSGYKKNLFQLTEVLEV